MNQAEVKNIVFDPQKLRQARVKKFPDKSLTYVAREVLEISPQQLSEYETGGYAPPLNTLARMCAVYGVDLLGLTSLAKTV
jgi:transcriptional regulator with XRE-family HTH domain